MRVRARRRFDAQKLVWQLLPGIALLLLWELGSGTLVDGFMFSKPSVIVARFVDFQKWNALYHIGITVQEMVGGYVIGSILGVALGYYLGFYRKVSRFVEPYILTFYGIPRIALAPLLIIWLGIGIYSKLFMAAVMVFFMVFYNTHLGVRSVNQELVNLARLMGANESHIVRKVVLPSITPYVMLGLRAAVPRTVIGAIVGEFVVSRGGIGYYVLKASANFDAAGLFAGIIVLLLFTLIATTLLSLVERRVLRWTRVGEGAAGR